MKLRVSAVQYKLRTIDSFEEFEEQVIHYVKMAEEFAPDFVLFPEFLTTQLLSIKDHGSKQNIEDLPRYTDAYLSLFKSLAKETGLHIIGGTHITREGDRLYNTAHLFFPDGRVGTQSKLHLTPTEVKPWHLSPGDTIQVFETAKGKVAIMICYDIEFPEAVRIARGLGADVIFCPSCTDDRHGFNRVRYTAHARTIENQVYVVVTGTVGSLPTVDFMRANFGQAAIITPNDICFPKDGLLMEGEPNNDMIITGDLDISLLTEIRETGSVTTWKDRRFDLYPDLGTLGPKENSPLVKGAEDGNEPL